MKALMRFVGKTIACSGAALSLICCLPLEAQIYTLNDNNSTATVNVGSSAGMSSWQINNGQGYANFLNQQWFWYRTTATGPASSIDTISVPSVTSPYGVGGRALSVTYAVPTYNVRVDYLMSGGSVGSGVSDIGETITINNTGNTTLSFHLFQYSDFNLTSTDSIQLGKNLRGFYNEAYQDSTTSPMLTETVISPGANHGEAALVGATLTEMAGASFSTLSDTTTAGPGNVTWAFEWDLTIAAGGSAIISKDKYLNIGAVPEPSTVALVVLGMAGVWFRRKH